MSETTTDPTAARPARALKKLSLDRETVHDASEQLLSSQGHSLWTCDSELQLDAAPVADRPERRS